MSPEFEFIPTPKKTDTNIKRDLVWEFIVSASESGERIDSALSKKSELNLTRSQIQKLIREDFIEVNKEIPKASYRLKAEDRVRITLPPPKPLSIQPENLPLDIVYEDSDLVVVNKARGMVTHPAAGNYSGTLVNALLYHCKDLSGIGGVLRPGIVHRLDKGTSGLMVVTKNDLAHQALAKQFKERSVNKKYVALVHGVMKQDAGVVETKLGRHPVQRKMMAVVVKGKEAITKYKVLERFKDYTLVELIIKTGRTHQIRVHMTHLGHPLVGDPTYGHRKEEFKTAGPLLHSNQLGFVHPRSEKYLEFKVEMPEDMREVIKKLPRK